MKNKKLFVGIATIVLITSVVTLILMLLSIPQITPGAKFMMALFILAGVYYIVRAVKLNINLYRHKHNQAKNH